MGRLPSGEPRKYQIQVLQEQHHQVLRLTALGFKPKVVAEMVGCTEATVGNIIHSELGKRQLAVIQSAATNSTMDIRTEIHRLAMDGIRVIDSLLNNENTDDSIRSLLARDMIDRDGFVAPKLIQGNFNHNHITHDDLEDIKQRAASIRASQAPLAIEEGDFTREVISNFETTTEKVEVER